MIFLPTDTQNWVVSGGEITELTDIQYLTKHLENVSWHACEKEETNGVFGNLDVATGPR